MLAAVILVAGLVWWGVPPDSRPVTRIEPLPALPTVAAAVEVAAPSPAVGVTVAAPDEPARPAAETPAAAIAPGEPSVAVMWPSRLEIPALDLVAPVMPAPVQGASWQVDHLGMAVGHLQKTAAPGTAGNVVLAGHVSLAGGAPGPFAGLSRLAAGDVVRVVQGGQQFEYLVSDARRVDANAVDVTYPTPYPELTLITCDGWDEAEGRYTARLVVKAALAGE
ncbi:MAG: hypothetical protein Kow0031_16930 [Anaerolineae bacterium]